MLQPFNQRKFSEKIEERSAPTHIGGYKPRVTPLKQNKVGRVTPCAPP
jgi:hypothetical protein